MPILVFAFVFGALAQGHGAATAAGDPQQAVIQWLTADIETAPQHLVSSAARQIAAVRPQLNANVETRDAFAMAFAPGGVARAHGQRVAAAGSIATIGAMEITVSRVTGNGARVAVPIEWRAGETHDRGTIELVREDGLWRVAAADFGAAMPRWPRFDSPRFVAELADLIESSARHATAGIANASALARVRFVQSAERAWADTHGGLFAPLECLATPARCDPASSESPYLEDSLSVPGYTPAFVAGYSATAAEVARAHAPRRSLKGWSFSMLTKDGESYCGDSTGQVCTLAPGTAVSGPTCPAACQPVK